MGGWYIVRPGTVTDGDGWGKQEKESSANKDKYRFRRFMVPPFLLYVSKRGYDAKFLRKVFQTRNFHLEASD